MTTFASDSFTGTDGTALSTHDSNWVRHTSSPATTGAELDTNRMRRSTVATAGSTYWYYNAAPGSADYEVSADMYLAALNVGLFAASCIARVDTSAITLYRAQFADPDGGTSDKVQLYAIVSGSVTQIGSNTSISAWSAGTSRNLRLKVNGSTIELFIDGSTTATISGTNSSITAAGYAGFHTYQANTTDQVDHTHGFHYDNFLANTLTTTTTVTVDAGTLSLTGQSVTDTVTAAVGAGTVTLTGQNVALQQQQPVTAGSASLTGQSIGVTITVPISPGTLSLTGSDVTVVPPSGSISVAVDPGTLTLTGQSVTSLTTVPVSAASSSLTGQNIGVTTTITVEPGSITLTGQAVAVNYIGTQTITVDPGTLSLSGRDVTVTVTGGTKGGIGKGKNFTLKQKKKLKQVVNQEWLKAEQTAKELLYERLGHAEPAKTKVERLTTVQSLGDVIAALQALSKETVTLPEQQAVIKSFEKSIDTKIVKTGERLVYVEDKVNETLGRIEKKIQNLEDLLIVIIDDLL